MSDRKRKTRSAAVPSQNAPAPPDIPADDEPQIRPLDWALIRRLLARLRPYRSRYILGISLSLLMVLCEMTSPLFMKAIINHCTGFAAGTLAPMPSEGQAIGWLAGLVAVWGLVLGAALLLHRSCIIIMTAAGEAALFGLRKTLFAHLQSLSMSFYDRTRLGRIISRCTSDVGSLREMFVWGLETIIKNTLIMLVAAVLLLWTDWRLFLAVVWLAPVLYLCNLAYRRRIYGAWQTVREGYTRLSTNLAENITGVRVVTAFNRQDWNIAVFNRLQDANTRNVTRAARINGVFQPSLQLIGFTGRAVILVYGGYLVAAGQLPGVGSVVAAFLYWDWLMGPVFTFGNFHNMLMQAMASAERVFSVLDTQPDVRDAPDAAPLPPVRGDVCFERVTFGYDPARPVLHEIDFEVRAGQTIALVGATGSGKTTIVSLLARFYQPQQGRVLIDGRDIRGVTGDSLHRQMGLVLQTNFLFSGTVVDNIRYARPDASDVDVTAAASALDTHEMIAALPEGYATRVGERGSSLSLGQRQLICFTRAYLADPRILLLDEATSAVDSKTELAVQRALARLLHGRTTFVVAHRLSTITNADCILVLDHGRIVERGTHRELLAEGGRYAALYREFAAQSMLPST